MDCLTICPHGTDTDVRCDARASVDQGGRRCNELDRRDLKRLPKRDGRQLHRSDLIRLVHDRPRLTRQINPSLSQQTKLLKILIVPLRSQPLPDIDQNRIAGIHHSL